MSKNPNDDPIEESETEQMTLEGEKKNEKVERTFRFHRDAADYIKEEASSKGVSENEVLEDILTGGFAVLSFEETTGKATLEFKSWKGLSEPVEEKPEDKPKVIKQYRDLRENFAPVTAGVNFHKKFATGGGFRVMIEDPRDDHQLEVQEAINTLNRLIYQDYYTRGMDRMLGIMTDEALTVGASACELVYENEFEFADFVTKTLDIPVNPDMPEKGTIKYIVTRMPTAAEWKKMGGIKRFKIIENAVERLVPQRDPITFEIMYWTLDELTQKKKDLLPKTTATAKEEKKEPQKFLPWQIFWLSWNTRGTELIGKSVIKPVLWLANMVKEIQRALAKGYRRWANKKYFLVCGSEKRPWGKIAQREFGKALAFMIKNNLDALPVPQGFDTKEIGGEVFDSRNLLDYLTGQICTGMTYPRDFLEQGRTRASDKAWLAWQVTYGEAQHQIRRAIEQQIWQAHVWCKFGLTIRVPKQGVKKRKQEKMPTYVPKVEWRSESKWHMTERLNMDVQILNIANPVGPQLKLAVERDIAKTMGWGEVILPSFEELEKELKALEKKMLAEGEPSLQAKRLEGGVSKEKAPTGMQKKPPPPAGGTRKPDVLTGTPLKKIRETIPDEWIEAFNETVTKLNLSKKKIKALREEYILKLTEKKLKEEIRTEEEKQKTEEKRRSILKEPPTKSNKVEEEKIRTEKQKQDVLNILKKQIEE